MIRLETLFSTKRINFKLMSKHDFTNLYTLDGDTIVRKFYPSGVLNKDEVKEMIEDNTELYKKHGFCDFILTSKDTNIFIGRGGFKILSSGEVEVGGLLLPKHWGKGYAKEILHELLLWASENITEVNYIIGITLIAHIAAQKVMQNCGMHYYKTDVAFDTKCKFFKKTLRTKLQPNRSIKSTY